MIAPTPGRVVWYYPNPTDTIMHNPGEPLAAIVAKVWTGTCVNLTIFDVNGNTHARTSVLLVQEGMQRPSSQFAEWMPYQIGQAKRAEVSQ